MEDKKTIYIGSTSETNGFLSTFFFLKDGCRVDGLYYPSSEHYFQSKKLEFSDDKYAEIVRNSDSSNQANYKGNDRKNGGILRPDWDAVKYDVMYDANYHKFKQNPYLKKMLLDTGDSIISSKSTSDTYWAITPNGGKDFLGKILMKIRDELKN